MSTKKIFVVAIAALSFNLVGQIAQAKVDKEEETRISHIAQDGMAEVKLGKLAEGKAKAEDIKVFARHMVTDHGKCNDELKKAATKDGVKLPADCNAEQKSTYDKLNKLSGEEFDTQYMAEMVKGHSKAVDAIGEESNKGTGALKDWAEKTLPTIKEHKKDADNINAKVLKK